MACLLVGQEARNITNIAIVSSLFPIDFATCPLKQG